jgi:hypothetical protein
MAPYSQQRRLAYILILATIWVLAPTAYARNEVLGEVQLQGAGKVEKDSGVWVDGQYLGYLKELKGTKKILLLPGAHQVEVRQAGYRDFSEQCSATWPSSRDREKVFWLHRGGGRLLSACRDTRPLRPWSISPRISYSS